MNDCSLFCKSIRNMGGLGVIVEYLPPSLGKESTKDKISCSGIFLGSGWILTHGTILIDALKEKKAIPLLETLKNKGIAINEKGSILKTVLDITKPEFKVIYDKNMQRNSIFQLSDSVHALPKASTTTVIKPMDLFYYSNPDRSQDRRNLCLPLVSSSPDTPGYDCHSANISMLFLQRGITDCLTTLMPPCDGWRLTEEKEGEETLDSDLESVALSLFVVLKTNIQKDKEENDSTTNPAEELLFSLEKLLVHTRLASKGANAYIESSPFGSLSPSVFLNSLSKGIISNISGYNSDIYLTDARCLMGGEGAPVYTVVNEKVHLSAIVISSFCWKNGEWLGLSILAAARPVLQILQNQLKNRIYDGKVSVEPGELSHIQPLRSNINNLSLEGIGRTLDNVVVGIACGGGWGSGIVINTSPGIILTCAHVVQYALQDEVTIITADRTLIKGQVVYRTHPYSFCQGIHNDGRKPGSSMWDIALVQTAAMLPESLPLASQLPYKGSSVIVAGHGIFNPYHFPAPSFSHGIISKIVCVDASCLTFPAADQGNATSVTQSKENLCCECENNEDFAHVNQRENLNGNSGLSRIVNHYSMKANFEDIGESDIEKLALLFGAAESNLVPVMFQTTCSVYAGNSGGPVVSLHPEYGLQVVGLMVCNTKDLSNKATFPHINLAVPASAIQKIIASYILTKDKKLLNRLGVECPTVSQLWALNLKPQSHL